jgi:hypothetical protein
MAIELAHGEGTVSINPHLVSILRPLDDEDD